MFQRAGETDQKELLTLRQITSLPAAEKALMTDDRTGHGEGTAEERGLVVRVSEEQPHLLPV